MPQYRHMVACFFCKRQFQFGAQVFDGERLRDWDLMVCYRCRRANHDGIVPFVYPHLATHLKARGIEPRKNARGWICWPEEQSD